MGRLDGRVAIITGAGEGAIIAVDVKPADLSNVTVPVVAS